MSTKITHKVNEQLTNITNIKLPKLVFKKVFRVRSASKDKQDKDSGMPGVAGGKVENLGKKGNQSRDKKNIGDRLDSRDKDKQVMVFRDYSNDKDKRSSSLKLSKIQSKKSLTKKRSTQSSSLQQNQPSTLKPHLITNIGTTMARIQASGYQFQTQIQKQHERNMQKLHHIAKMFDPQTIMKLGKKSPQPQQHLLPPPTSKQPHSGKHPYPYPKIKQHIRITSMLFENKYRQRCLKKGSLDDMDYWKKVNESLILNGGDQDGRLGEVSQEFRDIYETLVTE